MNSRLHEATKHEDEEEIDVDAVDLVRIKPIFINFALLPMLPAILVPVLQLLISIGCFLKLNPTFPEAPDQDAKSPCPRLTPPQGWGDKIRLNPTPPSIT